jgi:hypothetical protein
MDQQMIAPENAGPFVTTGRVPGGRRSPSRQLCIRYSILEESVQESDSQQKLFLFDV